MKNRPTYGTLDRLDIGIVSLLQNNGRMTTRQLANSLETTEVTIRKRLKQLLESRILTVRGFVEPAKLGYVQEAVLSLRVRVGQVEAAAEALTTFPEVRFVAITSGAHDIVCTIVVSETSELLRFTADKISQIEGVTAVDTALSLKVLKRASEWMPVLTRADAQTQELPSTQQGYPDSTDTAWRSCSSTSRQLSRSPKSPKSALALGFLTSARGRIPPAQLVRVLCQPRR